MLQWAVVFLVVALISGLLGFGVVAGVSLEFARIAFFLFLILFLVSLLFGGRGRFW